MSRSRNEIEAFAQRLESAMGETDAGARLLHLPGFASVWNDYLARLDTLPSLAAPGFAAQMVAPPHPVAQLGYFAAFLHNPNNHDSRFAAATLAMEGEVVSQLACMFGFAAGAGGHLTGGGTLANLDGLWSSRQRTPRGAIAFSEDAHFAHARICRLMGVEALRLPCDARGRVDLNHLEVALRSGRVGSVVLSAGTPGLGAVDPIADVVAMRSHYDFGIHVDASYGGFFALLRDESLSAETRRAFAAIAECDSVAVDPHKHAYQPYGCGCILFRDGGSGLFPQDSPYTEAASTSGLECSRPGAAAAALWLTLRCLPLRSDEGFGPLLRSCRSSARQLVALLEAGEHFSLHVAPELGVVSFLPRMDKFDETSATARRLVAAAEAEGVFLSNLRLPAPRLGRQGPDVDILRAVLMRPNQGDVVPMAATLERLAEGLQAVTAAPAGCG